MEMIYHTWLSDHKKIIFSRDGIHIFLQDAMNVLVRMYTGQIVPGYYYKSRVKIKNVY
jgi:hypothetical protein